MPSLSETITIPAPPDVVWHLLVDPGLVASCVPGAMLTHGAVSGVYEGSLRIRLGPASVVFHGEVRLDYFDGMRCTLDGRGRTQDGDSRATAEGVVTVSGFDTTVIKAEGKFEITGRLASIAETAAIEAARKLLIEFGQNLTRLITAEGVPAPEAEEIPMVEPQTVRQQARAAALESAAAHDGTGETSAEAGGVFGWLRRIVGGKSGQS